MFADGKMPAHVMKLSGRQLAIMPVSWDRGEATLAAVQEVPDQDKRLADSTVATVIARMEQKKLVTHRMEGGIFHNRPTVSADGVGRSTAGELLERIFGGSPSELVSHIPESDQVNAGEPDRIRQVVRQYESQRRQKGAGQSPGCTQPALQWQLFF